jgi:hypothetical protein
MKTRSIFFSVSPISLLTTRERYVRRNWHALLGNAERTHSLAGESGWLVQRQFDGFRHESNVTFRSITGHSVTPSKAAFQRRPGAATRHSRRRGLGCRLRPYSDNPSSGNSRPEAAQNVELAASHFALAPTSPTPIASPSPDSPSDSHAGRATSPWADSPIGRDTPLTHAGIARNISEARRIASVRLRVAAANP